MTGQSSILLVEDNDDDAELAVRALRGANLRHPIVRVSDGVEALDYLFGRAAYAGRDIAALPIVVFLDLHLPRLDGIEVLKAVRANALTRCTPIVMLTSSAEDRDRLAAYENYANSYVQKPVNYDTFVETARQLAQYWGTLNIPAPRAA
jgi:CheY-like chemotaxis protein